MNIATGLLDAPTEKTAGAAEYLGELLGKFTGSTSLAGKVLPEALGKANYGLAAGMGAGGSELLRRGLRRTSLNPYLADAIGVGAGGLVGGGSGAAGALAARVAPQVGGATAGRAAKNILGATAAGAGTIGLGEGAYTAYQAAKGITDPSILEKILKTYEKAAPGIQRATIGGAAATGGLAALNRDARRYLAGLGTSATGGSLLAPIAGVTAGLGAPIAGAGILGAAGLKNEAVRRAIATGGTKAGTGIANSYRFLRDGVPAGGVLAGLGGLTAASKLAPALYEAPQLQTLLQTMGDNPLTMGAAGGLAGLGALLNPTIRGGLSRGISGTARGISGAARGLYNAPAGSVLAGLGGLTAAGALAPKVIADPEVLTKLEPLLAAAKGSPVAMGAAGGLAGLGALRSGMTQGSMINRIARSAPGGTLPALGGAGLFAAGHPYLGAASMLSAPMVNRTSSRYIGDLLREFRAMRSNKRALDGLYKKSSLEKKSHIKLAAPVFLTKPAYILDAPTMDKVGFIPEALEFGANLLGKSQRGLKGQFGRLGRRVGFGGRTHTFDKGVEALQRGARERGQNLSLDQARRQAEQFLRQDAGMATATAKGPQSTRAAASDLGTQFEGTGDILKARLDRGVEGRGFFNRLFGGGVRQRGRNIQSLEEQMYQRGRQGTAPTAPTANLQPAADAQARLTQAEQAAQRAQQEATIGRYDTTRMEYIEGAESLRNQARNEVSRLTPAVETAQQNLRRAEEAAQQARQNYFQTNFGIDAPTQSLGELEARLTQVRADQASLNPLRKVDPREIKSLEDQIGALEATEAAQIFRAEPGLNASKVRNLAGQDQAAIKATYTQLQQQIASRGAKGPTSAQKNQLELLEQYMGVTPSVTNKQIVQGSQELRQTVGTNLTRPEREAVFDSALINNMGNFKGTPQQMAEGVRAKITQLENAATRSPEQDALLTKLRGAQTDVTTGGALEFTGEGFAGLQGRLGEIQQNLARQRDYGGVASAEAAIDPLRAPLQTAQDALRPAQEQLTQATSNLEAAQRAARRAQQRVGTRTEQLTQAQQAQQRTTDLLAAQTPLTAGSGSKLQAPIQESLAKTKAKPEVVDAIGQSGLGQSGQVNERLVRLEASGINTGELINTTANSAGLPKAVKRVNKASDSLIAEATANISGTTNLATNEAEALNAAVRRLSAQGEPLNQTTISTAITDLGGSSTASIDAAAAELERLTVAGSGSRAGEAYNQASTASREAYQKFTNQLEDQISRATGRADRAGLERTNKAVGEATKTERSFMDFITRRNKGIADRTEEQIAAFNEMGALTNARVEAIRAEVALKGPNAAVAESTIPQIRSASEAIANSNNPQAAAEWSRMLQDPGNIAQKAEALAPDSALRGILQESAPRLLEPGEQAAFALSNQSARTLEQMIPRGGRGAQGIDAEVSRVFNRDVLSRPESVEGQELIRMMDGSGAKIKINGKDTNLGQALEQLNRGTGTQRSAAQKLMEGAENASAFTAEELSHLGVSQTRPTLPTTFSGSGAQAADATTVQAALDEAVLRGGSSSEGQLKWLEEQLAKQRGTKPKGKRPPSSKPTERAKWDAKNDRIQQRVNSLQDAVASTRTAQSATNTAFETQLLQPMSRARNSLRESIAKDTYVDIGNLQRNTDVASIRVGDDFAKLYREPQLTEEGVAVFNPADITKQINQLKKNPRNSMVTEEALTDRVIMENLEIFRAKNPEATQEQLQAAYQGLLEASGRGQASAMELVAGGQQKGLGVGGMLGGTAVIGGGAYAANNRPAPITQAAQQMRPAASWGLSPLHAPVQYRKKTASLLAAPLHKLAMDMPKPLKVPLPEFKPNKTTKAPVEAQEVGIASPTTSMLTAPVMGGGY